MSAMLEVKDLVVSYGKIKAVKGISFDVEQGSVVSLIGTNGAGKTTTLRTISARRSSAACRLRSWVRCSWARRTMTPSAVMR